MLNCFCLSVLVFCPLYSLYMIYSMVYTIINVKVFLYILFCVCSHLKVRSCSC